MSDNNKHSGPIDERTRAFLDGIPILEYGHGTPAAKTLADEVERLRAILAETGAACRRAENALDNEKLEHARCSKLLHQLTENMGKFTQRDMDAAMAQARAEERERCYQIAMRIANDAASCKLPIQQQTGLTLEALQAAEMIADAIRGGK